MDLTDNCHILDDNIFFITGSTQEWAGGVHQGLPGDVQFLWM